VARRETEGTDLVALQAGVVFLLRMLPQLILVIEIKPARYTEVMVWALSVMRLKAIFRFEGL